VGTRGLPQVRPWGETLERQKKYIKKRSFVNVLVVKVVTHRSDMWEQGVSHRSDLGEIKRSRLRLSHRSDLGEIKRSRLRLSHMSDMWEQGVSHRSDMWEKFYFV